MLMKKRQFLVLVLSTCISLFCFIPAMGSNAIFISDLDWTSVQVGYGSAQKDKGQEGLPLRLRNAGGATTTFEKGLCLHAASKVVYDIEGLNVEKFQSYIGINYSKTKGSCKFIVRADSQKIYESVLLKESSVALYVNLDIPASTKKLTLETTDGGDGIDSDHSIWADAKVILGEDAKIPIQEVNFQIQKEILNIGQESETELSVLLLNNELLDLGSSEVSVTYTSSDPTVVEINDNGTIKGITLGSVMVSCSVEYNGEIRTESAGCIVGDANNTTSWMVKSPNDQLQVGFVLNENGTLNYMSYLNDKKVVSFSSLGLISSIGDFTKGLIYENLSENQIKDNYELTGAKTSYVESEANEITLTFSKGDATFKVIARVYNDGFAFRYGIEKKDGTSVALKISSEQTSLQLPGGTISQAMSYISHHEAVAYEKKFADLNEEYIMPFLYETPDNIWALVSEAALSPEYCGAQIKGNKNGRLDIIFSSEQTTDVSTKTAFVSPWRFVVVGTPKTIVENTMPENLSPPMDETLFPDGADWVKPGVSAWTWLNRESTSDFDTYKKYIDMAASMGWEYLLLDEGWQPKSSQAGYTYYGYYDWTTELIEYANEKGVGLLVWANNGDLNTDQKREKAFAEWEKMGFKGVKPDFFNSQSQSQMKFYDALMKGTAKYNLLLNPHGANKTTGERRTYPNTLTREGVFGAEQDLFKPAEMSARWNCMLPFTRNAVGPADFTPMLSYRVSGSKRNYTVSHMAAMAIVYESGIQCLADRTEVYLNSPARSLLADIPASWDETILIDGIPGEYVNIARRNGEDWYVGIMCNEKRDAQFNLDFLGEGTYTAFIYKDGNTVDAIVSEMQQVTNASTLNISLAKTGGASVKFTKTPSLEPEKIEFDSSELSLFVKDKYVFSTKITPVDAYYNKMTWTSSEETVASIKDGVLDAKKVGTTTVKVTTGSSNQIETTCLVEVKKEENGLNSSWEIIRENSANWKLDTNTSLTITTASGELYPGTTSAQNIFLTDAKDNDFSFSCKLDFNPAQDYLSAGLIVYAGDDKLFGTYRRYHSGYGGNILAVVSQNGGSFSENQISDPQKNSSIYLKVIKSGTSFSGFYSTDNENWVQIKSAVVNSSLSNGESLKIGLYAVSGNGKTGKVPATFTNFAYSSDNSNFSVIPFSDVTGMKEVIPQGNISIFIEGKEVQIDNPENQEVSIYAVTGQKVKTSLTSFSCQLNSGVYIVSVTSVDGKVESRKILVK